MPEADLTAAGPCSLHFGAGNVGRGLLGIMLVQSGYRVVFADVAAPLIEAINSRRRYSVWMLGPRGATAQLVDGVSAVDARNTAQTTEAICNAELITTAVGADNLPEVADALADGLQARAGRRISTPVNVIACENLLGNSRVLRSLVLERLPVGARDRTAGPIGFPVCVVDRIIPGPTAVPRGDDPLAIAVGEAFEFTVERTGLVGLPRSIRGMTLVDDIGPYAERKLFTLNTVHAVVAYLGWLRSHTFIHEAVADTAVHAIAAGALRECSAMLIRRHGFEVGAQQQYAGAVLTRFELAALPDPIARVAREPIRKLRRSDRLIRPALLALEHGVEPAHLARGIAAAIQYDGPQDDQAIELSKALRANGLEHVLIEVCGLGADDPLAALIRDAMPDVEALKRGG